MTDLSIRGAEGGSTSLSCRLDTLPNLVAFLQVIKRLEKGVLPPRADYYHTCGLLLPLQLPLLWVTATSTTRRAPLLPEEHHFLPGNTTATPQRTSTNPSRILGRLQARIQGPPQGSQRLHLHSPRPIVVIEQV